MKNIPDEGKVRLWIDFPSVSALLQWCDTMGYDSPEGGQPHRIDGLDDRSVSDTRTFVLKRSRDRIPGTDAKTLAGL